MKNPTTDQLTFSNVSGKKVTGVFDDHRVTSDAGALLLREVDKSIGVIDVLTDAIVDTRHPSYVKHETWEMNAQRVFPWPRAGRSGWGTRTPMIATSSRTIPR